MSTATTGRGKPGRPAVEWQEGDLKQCTQCLDWVPIEQMTKAWQTYKGKTQVRPGGKCKDCHNRAVREKR